MADGVGDGASVGVGVGVGDDVVPPPPQAARSIARSILQASRTKLCDPCLNCESIKSLPPQVLKYMRDFFARGLRISGDYNTLQNTKDETASVSEL